MTVISYWIIQFCLTYWSKQDNTSIQWTKKGLGQIIVKVGLSFIKVLCVKQDFQLRKGFK